jgi:hypothetical protein
MFGDGESESGDQLFVRDLGSARSPFALLAGGLHGGSVTRSTAGGGIVIALPSYGL